MNTAGRIAAFAGGALAGAGINWLIGKIPPDAVENMDVRPLAKVVAGSSAIVYGREKIGLEAAAGMGIVPLFSAFSDYQNLPESQKQTVGLAILAGLAGAAFLLSAGRTLGKKE